MEASMKEAQRKTKEKERVHVYNEGGHEGGLC